MKSFVSYSFVLGLLLSGTSVMAQLEGQIVGGAAVKGASATINAGGVATTVNWSKFYLESGQNLNFTNNTVGVLNNISGLGQLYGNVTSTLDAGATVGGAVYFYAPGGLVIGKGATIKAGRFLVSAKSQIDPATGAIPANFTGIDLYAFDTSGLGKVASFTAEIGKAGTQQNIWVVGTEYRAYATEYGIGASPMTNQSWANAYKNVATVTATVPDADFLAIFDGRTGALGGWYGSFEGADLIVQLASTHKVWLDSANVFGFFADGGYSTWAGGDITTSNNAILNGTYAWVSGKTGVTSGGSVTINNGGGYSTWVAGNINAVGNVNLNGTYTWVSGKTGVTSTAGDVGLGQAGANYSTWVVGNITGTNVATDGVYNWAKDVTATAGNASLGSANTYSNWTNNVTANGGNVFLDGVYSWHNNITATDTTPASGVGNIIIGNQQNTSSVWFNNTAAAGVVVVQTVPASFGNYVWGNSVKSNAVGINTIAGVNQGTGQVAIGDVTAGNNTAGWNLITGGNTSWIGKTNIPSADIIWSK